MTDFNERDDILDEALTEELEDISIPEETENPTVDEQETLISVEEIEIDIDLLSELITARSYGKIREMLEPLPAIDIADIFAELEARHRALLFRIMPKEMAADVFVEMDADLQRALIEGFSDSELSSYLEELYLDDTADIIEEMPAAVVKRIIKNSTPENRLALNRLLKYDSNTAGALMTTEYVRLSPDMTVGEALAHIKRVAIDKETIYTCYVTDKKRHLVGIVTARSLLISDTDTPLADIMEENVIFARTGDDKEEVALLFDRYGFIALPVVDSETRHRRRRYRCYA